MIRTILIAWALLFFCVPARAAESDVTPELVCAVKSAVRPGEPAWPSEKCSRVAAALNVTRWPRTLLSIAAHESDLRDRAIAWHGRDVADVGLLGLRCRIERGRCTNGPARGYTVAELRDPETSIAVSNVLLTNLAGDVQGWNRRSKCYAARIRALVAALDGRRVEVPSARTMEQVRRILEAVKRTERNS